MALKEPRIRPRQAYIDAAQEYLHSLPPAHFMEATTQGTQRKITLESLDLVHARRPEVQTFNELLVQYEIHGREKLGQVVPDNMIVVHPEPILAEGSYDLLYEPARPFCVLEYVSKSNKRKEYEDNMQKYERELKVPYYLLFYPDAQELTLYRHNKRKYVSVKPNAAGRLEIGPLDLEVAILDDWVRFWYQGKLLALPADLQRDLDETRRKLVEARRQLGEARARLGETQTQLGEALTQRDEERRARLEMAAELARLREQLRQQQED